MVEILIIAALVLWSALVVFKKVFPKTSNTFFSFLSNACSKRGWTSLARWLQPAMSSGCGGNCGCDAQDEPKKVEVQAVKWK